MAITREKKQELVAQYKALIAENNGFILTSYSGITVKELEELRAKIRDLDGNFMIVKNSLIQMAMEDAGFTLSEDTYVGTTALGFAQEEIPALAKTIVDMAKESEGMRVKAGVMAGETLAATEVEQLASLPALPVVQAQLLGVIQAPAGRLAGVVASGVRQAVNVLQAYAESEPETAAA